MDRRVVASILRLITNAPRTCGSLWGLIERSGFREYYEPFTGQRFGARDFTWSGLLST